MFHCKKILLVAFLICGAARAETTGPVQVAKAPAKIRVPLHNVSVSYQTWLEKMTLDQAAATDRAYALFAGTGVLFERQKLWGSAWKLQSGLVFGQATGGGSQSVITYTAAKSGFWGALLGLAYETQATSEIYFSGGLQALYRSMTWKTDTVGLSVKSGADVNALALVELRARLNAAWDVRQQVGMLLINGSTYWLLGLGYQF